MFRRTIPAVLAFSLSGAFCLLMCATMCARVEASGRLRPCCERSAAIDREMAGSCATPGPEVRSVGGRFNCCFLSGRTSARAPLPDGRMPVPEVASVRCYDVAASVYDGVRVADFHAPPLDHGDTHARICVFLI